MFSEPIAVILKPYSMLSDVIVSIPSPYPKKKIEKLDFIFPLVQRSSEFFFLLSEFEK